MIELHEQGPPLTSDELAAAEDRLAQRGYRLPPNYRQFLLDHNGGQPIRTDFSFDKAGRPQNDLVHVLLGVGYPTNADLVFTAGIDDTIPRGVLPVASDPFGNLICVDGRGDPDGPVLFWDHEEISEPPDESNLYFVAPDLKTFLDGLTEPPPPEAPPQARRGWRARFKLG